MTKSYLGGISAMRWLAGTLQYGLRPINGGALDWFDVLAEVAAAVPQQGAAAPVTSQAEPEISTATIAETFLHGVAQAEPVAEVCRNYELRWAGAEPLTQLLARHPGVKVGSMLYAHPAISQAQAAPQAGTVAEREALRLGIAAFESMIGRRPQHVEDALGAMRAALTTPSAAPEPVLAGVVASDAYPALKALTEALLTHADNDYLRRQIDAAVKVIAAHGCSTPVPWPDESFGVARWGIADEGACESCGGSGEMECVTYEGDQVADEWTGACDKCSGTGAATPAQAPVAASPAAPEPAVRPIEIPTTTIDALLEEIIGFAPDDELQTVNRSDLHHLVVSAVHRLAATPSPTAETVGGAEAMSTLTLNLDERYTEALDALALDADMSKTAVLRAAIRLYQFVQSRRGDGYELAFTKDGKTHPMILIDHRLPGFDSND